MAVLNIKDAETHRLATELAQSTGQTLTAAVKHAIQEQLVRVRAGAQPGHEREVQPWLAYKPAAALTRFWRPWRCYPTCGSSRFPLTSATCVWHKLPGGASARGAMPPV